MSPRHMGKTTSAFVRQCLSHPLRLGTKINCPITNCSHGPCVWRPLAVLDLVDLNALRWRVECGKNLPESSANCKSAELCETPVTNSQLSLRSCRVKMKQEWKRKPTNMSWVNVRLLELRLPLAALKHPYCQQRLTGCLRQCFHTRSDTTLVGLTHTHAYTHTHTLELARARASSPLTALLRPVSQ